MRILSLTLHKNRRIGLGQIGTLEYKPERKMQLILGTNGSGKSTLLQELFPIPITTISDYEQDGYKSITVEHNKSIYTIKTYRKENTLHHHFIMDDTELNPSGKRNKQLSLIEEHFGIDSSVCQILSGQIEFTRMSYTERKKWFIKISNVDYDYVLSVYLSIQSRYKEVKNNIKLIKHKIVSAEKSLVDNETMARLKESILAYKSTISLLLEKKPIIPTNTIPLETVLERLSSLSDKINDILSSLHTPYKELVEDYSKTTSRLEECLSEIRYLEKTLEKMRTIEKELVSGSDDIDIELAKIKTAIEELHNKEPELLSVDGIEKLEPVLDRVAEIVRPYKDVDETKQSIVTKRQAVESELKKLDEKLKRLDHILSTHTSKTTCPKCGFSFIPGTKLESIDSVRNLYEKHRLSYEKLEKEKDRYLDIEYTIDTNNKIQQYLVEKASVHPVLDYVLSKILSNGKIDKDNINKLYVNVLPIVKEYVDKKHQYEVKQKEKEAIDRHKGIDIDTFRKDIEKTEANLLSCYNKKRQYEDTLKALKDQLERYDSLKQTRDELEDTFRHYRKAVKIEMDKSIEASIRQYVDMLRDQLDKLEKQYLDQEKIRYEIEKDTQLLTKLEIEEKELLDAMVVLSPDKGLIAMSMVSFLDSFIARMNDLLRQIWEYPIEIRPCRLDGKDLDYRFPVIINDSLEIADISKTSSSMQEIINLSFKIGFMEAMGLSNWPLYLDEFGRAMDDKHQQNAYAIIEQLQDSDFSQIFLISHYEHCYGRFVNADVNVLHIENLPTITPTATMTFIPV